MHGRQASVDSCLCVAAVAPNSCEADTSHDERLLFVLMPFALVCVVCALPLDTTFQSTPQACVQVF